MNRHGRTEVAWEDDIFVVHVAEAFNEDGLAFMFSRLKELIKSKDFTFWRRLEIWDEEVLGSPETIQIGKAIYAWYEENGCTHTAVVVRNGVQEQIIRSIFKSGAKVFRNEEEAKEWLKSVG
tara:strand:- start:378 stop:743 length:366 start_codon:yes stop_codon:yes gene_type:complete